MRFETERKSRDKIISVRMTEEQAAALAAISEDLGYRGIAEAIRVAIDFWIQNERTAKNAARNYERRR